MKKVLLAFAILGFVACNNETEKKEATDTTTVAPATVDTSAVTVDTTKHDTTAPVKADTTKK